MNTKIYKAFKTALHELLGESLDVSHADGMCQYMLYNGHRISASIEYDRNGIDMVHVTVRDKGIAFQHPKTIFDSYVHVFYGYENPEARRISAMGKANHLYHALMQMDNAVGCLATL